MGMYGSYALVSSDAFLSGDVGDWTELDGYVGAAEIDKAWHVLSYLLHQGPGASVPIDPVLGGTPFSDDWGYGPPRYLTVQEAGIVHRALDAVSDDEVRSSFDPAALTAAAVYPSIWDESPESLWTEFVAPHLTTLREVYRQASADGLYVLLLIE